MTADPIQILPGLTVHCCALDGDSDMALATAAATLSAGERDRAAKFHFARDRDRYVRGRGFLRHVLGEVLGEDAKSVALRDGLRGKPEVATADGPQFNLSHTGDFAVLAVSQVGPIGIDIEWSNRAIDAAQMAKTCFVASEIDALLSVQGTARTHRFYRFWTAKEALMKLTGAGMWLEPTSIELLLRGGDPVGFVKPTTQKDTVLIFADLGRAELTCALAGQGPEITSVQSKTGNYDVFDKGIWKNPSGVDCRPGHAAGY